MIRKGALWAAALTAAWSVSAAAAPAGIQVTSLDSSSAESTATTPTPSDVEFREPIVEEPAAAMEAVYQQQILQQEVQELRGMLEQLAQQIKEMSQRQADRYQDVDRRLEDLRLMVNELASTGPASGARPVAPALPAVTPATPAVAGGKDEKTLYDTALEMIRNRQYEAAIGELQQIIDKNPTGEYAPNAYYWLGEVYAALPEPNYEKARQALAQVISFFPDNRKVPDAAFKLGKVYHLMGDCGRAKELLNQVIRQYPGTSPSKLAESYLKDKVKCDS